jgi:hypothetical protein
MAPSTSVGRDPVELAFWGCLRTVMDLVLEASIYLPLGEGYQLKTAVNTSWAEE